MRTLTRRLAPHVRTSWLAFGAVAAVALAVALVLLHDAGRPAVVATVFMWFVLVVVLGAFLDAILAPGNPDVRRPAGHAAGWTGAFGGQGDGGGSLG